MANSALLGQICSQADDLSPAVQRRKNQCRALLKTFVLSFAGVSSAVTAAFAETQWERNHPRRDQVNDRLAHQNHRIDRELKEGEITKRQANQLHREDRTIRHEERAMAKINGGHITKGEQKALNQQENAVSRQIGR